MNIRAILWLSTLCLVCSLPAPCFSADKEIAEELPSKSPDGKFLVRPSTEAERDKQGENAVPKPGLYDVSSGRHIACPILDSMEEFMESLRVVWSKDSTHLAINFRSDGRFYTTCLCELKDGKSINLPSPENMLLGFLEYQKTEQIKEMGLKPNVFQRYVLDLIAVRRWIDENTIEVDAQSIRTVPVKSKDAAKDDEPEIVDVTTKFRFTLKLDAQKQEWKIVKSEKLKKE